MDNKLSKYASGSIKEVLTISVPLMIAIFSFNFMLFMDRVILARYSIESMSAAGVLTLMVILFQFLIINIASIAEVIIGRHYGAKEFSDIGRPVWQMIWFSLAISIPFHFIGQYGYSFFVPEQYGAEGIKYFRILMSFSFLSPIVVALSAFFIARGKTKVVTFTAIFANGVNMILAYLFVFGVDGLFEAGGLVGSAYAVIIATAIQAMILFFFFATPYNIKHFKVLKFSFDYQVMKECIRIGLPNAIGHFIEIACWAMINRYLSKLSIEHITIGSIAINFLIACSFITEGLQKGVIAIASNAIGSKNLYIINKTIVSSLKIVFVCAAIIALPLLVFPELTISTFFTTLQNDRVLKYAALALIGSWLFFVFDGITWIFAAVLTSGGDTKFIMFISACNSWFFAGLPLLLFVDKSTPEYIPWIMILPVYSFINMCCCILRYKYGKWRQKLLA